MKRTAFEKIVDEEVEKIPEHFQRELKNVIFVVEESPPEGEDLLGVFEGVPLGEQGSSPWELPGQIVIFQRPTEEEALASGLTVQQVVRDTIWHEVAHYFGMEEDEVRHAEERRSDKNLGE